MLAIILAIFGSTAFWELLKWLLDRRSTKTKLLIGLAHNQLVATCETYIERGYITLEEYNSLRQYLYEPYIELGGNGMAVRLIKEVDGLPIRKEGHDGNQNPDAARRTVWRAARQ